MAAMARAQDWGQQQLQGTLFGRFAQAGVEGAGWPGSVPVQCQACEEGPNFTRARRGGTNVFVPDETDGIEAVGSSEMTRARGEEA